MYFKTHNTIYYALLVAILAALLLLCADLFVHAAFGDHTALGDPYYQDTILANERAPVALIASWLVVLLSLVASFVKPKTGQGSAGL